MSDERRKKLSRREALGLLSAAGTAVSVAACSGGNSPTTATPVASTPTTTTTPATTTVPGTSTASCVVTPNETEGPFPSIALPTRGDVREDRQGLRLDLAITVVNTNAACAPVSNATVEIWQCDAAGNYSEYGNLTSATFLRGVQPMNASGVASFITVYPGWYQGRATHIHVEVMVNGRSVKTTQIAFPEDVNNTVYASGVYASKGQNPTRNSNDMVFSDGVSSELATISGNTSSGYTATFTVGVAL
jgi:protocatechuate 3,4-dioxygenase beta subunit